jgi:hypothetical protein
LEKTQFFVVFLPQLLMELVKIHLDILLQ